MLDNYRGVLASLEVSDLAGPESFDDAWEGDLSSVEAAREMLQEIQQHCLKKAMPLEVQQLGRTNCTWFDKICNYHLARVSNGPTEALNNLIKRIKRIGFGFRTSIITAYEHSSTLASPTGEFSTP